MCAERQTLCLAEVSKAKSAFASERFLLRSDGRVVFNGTSPAARRAKRGSYSCREEPGSGRSPCSDLNFYRQQQQRRRATKRTRSTSRGARVCACAQPSRRLLLTTRLWLLWLRVVSTSRRPVVALLPAACVAYVAAGLHTPSTHVLEAAIVGDGRRTRSGGEQEGRRWRRATPASPAGATRG